MSKGELIQRQTSLSRNVVSFCRYLRKNKFKVGTTEEADALIALTKVPLTDPAVFKLVLESTLVKSLQQAILFEDHYNKYWTELSKAVDSKKKTVEEQTKKKRTLKDEAAKRGQPSLQALKSWLYGNQATDEKEVPGYSYGKLINQKDFSLFTEEELQEVTHLVKKIGKILANRYGRRFKKGKPNDLFDVKSSIQKNMRKGGDIVEMAFKKRQKRRLRIVLLCDISKSMDLYSRFLIQFIYAFQNAYTEIETFVFGTELNRITEELRKRNYKDALAKLRDKIYDWSGGTRIGECLEDFNKDYLTRLCNQNTVFMIMSDGLDTGESDLIAPNLKRIQSKCRKVIWLNPIAGNPDYEPTVKGMKEALPYIDVFTSGHNLESLKKIITIFGKRKQNQFKRYHHET